MTRGQDTSTTFGFESIDAQERQERVNRVFADVADRYDLMNDLMSGGLHRLWKSDFISLLAPPRCAVPFRLLDVAGGTGDIAMRVIRRGGPGCRAVICDISPEMLDVGRRRVQDAGLADQITCVEGNAEALTFEDQSFDAYTIAFGIRNVTHIERALVEAFRVLKPGGRFLCLEFSEVDVPVLDRLYDFHSFEVIPRLGELVAGSGDPYRYLVESIRRFPDQDTFADMISDAGFSRVTYRNLTGGVAAIHGGWRI
ncbi:MAG: bifunctional demethylmenaquinone methyltransferase/2-methoxy-6-polyprenyl-1,4-benzoquinol methylase UbiE [Pseudomonadota bacterium]